LDKWRNGERNLWVGIGLTPGTAEEMYSGQAEAFGVLAGVLFFSYYTSCFPMTNYRHVHISTGSVANLDN